MEVVKTPTFWCPHVERVACTNFSLRIVELRPPESREIFPFSFSSFSFSLPFSLRTVFSFSLFSFLFAFLLFFSFSHLISLSFSPFSLHFLLLFGAHHTSGQKKGNFLPISSNQLCGPQFSISILYFIIPLYDIIHYMAQYEPWDSFPTHG